MKFQVDKARITCWSIIVFACMLLCKLLPCHQFVINFLVSAHM